MLLLLRKNDDFFVDKVLQLVRKELTCDIIEVNESSNIYVQVIDLDKRNVQLRVDDKLICFDEINLVWYQGGIFPIPDYKVDGLNKELSLQAIRFIRYEWEIINSYLIALLQEKEHVGNFFLVETNKLKNLEIAKECGFIIPHTIVTQNPEIVKDVKGQQIIKPIGESFPFYIDNVGYRIFTEKLNKSIIPDKFFPSLVQEEIERNLEIRVFVIFETQEFFAMAIINSSKDTVDYRSTNSQNRFFPYKLESDICIKLSCFMQKTGLDTASFDLIRDKRGQYVFLEVNPQGNIDMLNWCGYELEKKISRIIINKYKRTISS